MADFLPAEMSVRTQRLYDVIERYGYLRYDGPILEPVEIYEAKSSQEIVEQQLYTLTDRGERRLALRPEMTPTVAGTHRDCPLSSDHDLQLITLGARPRHSHLSPVAAGVALGGGHGWSLRVELFG